MDMYMRLSYDEYKEVERQMRAFKESVHTSVDGYYHKSFRMRIGDLQLEFHGPIVKAQESIVVIRVPPYVPPAFAPDVPDDALPF